MKNRSSGFTLIELIVVMAIIMILAGLITGAAMKAKQRALVAQTRTMISGLETALGMLQMDLGGYSATGNASLVTTLTTMSGSYYVNPTTYSITSASGWSGPYMNFKVGEVSGGTARDAWGTALTYNNPGTAHSGGPDYTTYVDIWSNGPDKTSGTADDVSNWTR